MKESELDNLYSDFLSTLSHELRTPLTSIRGFSQTMIESYYDLSDEQKIKFLKIIEEQSMRLIKLVENLLAVSRLESQKEKLVYKSFDPVLAVENILQMIKIKFKKHIFQMEIKSSILKAFADKDKFEQIIINLLDNAAKYSSVNTIVKIQISMSSDDKYVIFNIIDQGIGIKKENYEKVFEKFLRIENVYTRTTEGSGIGLYLSKCAAISMNGDINVVCDNRGTVFTLKLPSTKLDSQVIKKLNEE